MVSEVMLQQTQVSAVVPFYESWLKRFPTFHSLAAASENDVLHAWQGLGYYRRARNLHGAAKLVVRQYCGVLPSDPKLIRQLRGMGRYTSNAVATFAFNRSLPIVEANITRVLTRLFNINLPIDSAAGSAQLWKTATALVPGRNARKFNSALMDLGAVVCRKTPNCQACPVQTSCRAPTPALLPVKRPRPNLKLLTEPHSFSINRGRILLQQCTGRWRGMWMLPPERVNARDGKEAIYESVFPFTNHRITLRVFRNSCSRQSDAHIGKRRPHVAAAAKPVATLLATARPAVRWFSIAQLKTIPVPSPHRRALAACLSLDAEGSRLNVKP